MKKYAITVVLYCLAVLLIAGAGSASYTYGHLKAYFEEEFKLDSQDIQFVRSEFKSGRGDQTYWLIRVGRLNEKIRDRQELSKLPLLNIIIPNEWNDVVPIGY